MNTRANAIPDLRINSDRMLAAFNELALIGATGDGGVNRPTFSEAHLAARRWFREQIGSAGLEFRTDGAGNHSVLLACGNDHAPTLLLGSHLDSVPNGGRFDGALGVMAAFEVLRTIKDAQVPLKVNLEAIDFTDEEGTLVGLLGSAALAGRLHPEVLQNPRGGREALLEGMRRAGLSEESILSAARPKGALAGYLELHIEQGKRLERAGIDVGIVSAIVGIWSYRLSFLGRADHAGTTTMDDRLDASLGASAFTLAAREIVRKDFPNCVVNVGKMDCLAPTCPGAVDVSLDSFSDEEEFKHSNSVCYRAHEEAHRFGGARI
jgi:N-carbamoyl-L-amino-acid hydrolase